MTNFEVINGAASVSVISVPSKITAGVPFSLKIVVQDAYGNDAKDYFGTIHFSNTAGIAALPADYAFTSLDAGRQSLTVTLSTPGLQTLTVADAANAISSSVNVNVKA
jgi:hypothetical protein